MMYTIHYKGGGVGGLMKRTQIYLTEEERKVLKQKAKQEHTTVSNVIRINIDRAFLSKSEFPFEHSLNKVFGLWKDREDLLPTDQYLRHIRKGKRLNRWH